MGVNWNSSDYYLTLFLFGRQFCENRHQFKPVSLLGEIQPGFSYWLSPVTSSNAVYQTLENPKVTSCNWVYSCHTRTAQFGDFSSARTRKPESWRTLSGYAYQKPFDLSEVWSSISQTCMSPHQFLCDNVYIHRWRTFQSSLFMRVSCNITYIDIFKSKCYPGTKGISFFRVPFV